MSERALPRSAPARDALVETLEKFDVRSPVEFSYCGEAPIDARNFHAVSAWAATSGQGEDSLVKAIQATLYDRCYAQRENSASKIVAPAPEFARRLAVANMGRERWDKGWVVQQFGSSGQAIVRKGDRERTALPGLYVFDGAPGMTPQIGSAVSLRAPSGSFESQPGYYFAFGETLDEMADQLSTVRFYFNCAAESAAELLRELTLALNCFQTPFQMKMPSAPDFYGRTDAGVLYVGQRYFHIVSKIVAQALEKIALAAATPLFAKMLWPGVAAAVEPGTGESFGSHRCRLTAEGIVDAWLRGEQAVQARLAAVTARFAAAGLDVSRPWLGPNGVDLFQVPEPVRIQ